MDDRLCAKAAVFCWWDAVRHLIWSVLGLADADKLGTTDETPVLLLWLLYAMFLIMVVILLVNMLIAVLSNVYQGVEDNSLPEWCFKYAITHRTYSNYHLIPVPLNLISMPFMFLSEHCCKVTIKTRKESGTNTNKKNKAMRKLMQYLEGKYLAVYGHSFPLSDERKLDKVMEELSGNRRTTNHIAQRVFSNENLHSEDWEGTGIMVDGNTLTYSAPGDCRNCKYKEPAEHHSVLYWKQLDSSSPEFEVLIQECGERRLLAIGVWAEGSHRFRDLCHGRAPGWVENSVGYHIDDGKIFFEDHHKHGQELEDAMAHRGDIITCRIHHNEKKGSKVQVSFSLNGKELWKRNVKSAAGGLYPCIGMGYKGIKVQFTMGRFIHSIPKAIMDKQGDKLEEKLEQLKDKITKIELEDKEALFLLKTQVSEMNRKLQHIMTALKIEND